MILASLETTPAEFAAATGWELKPEGACRGDVCVPLAAPVGPGTFDVGPVAERLGMALVHDDESGAWAVGPAALGRALVEARAPELVLPDLDGNPFALSSLRGRKVFLLAWASW